MIQARSIEEDCYMFANSKASGLTCNGCRHENFCGTEDVIYHLKGTMYE